MRRLLLVGLLLLTATACPGEDDDDDRPASRDGTISGALTPFRSGAGSANGEPPGQVRSPLNAAELAGLREKLRALKVQGVRRDRQVVTDPLLPIVPPPLGAPPLAKIPQADPTIPGDVIVRFEEAGLTPQRVLEAAKLAGYRAVHKGYASEYLHLVGFEALDGHAVTADETRALVAQLAAVPGVRYTERNLRMHKLATPNDRGYSLQWHYPTLNLPAAWDIESEANGVVVAVLDSGIVPHPDLDGQQVPGYDFIEDASNAGDGTGRDNNPLDEGGDEPNGGSSWHGTHVAGTIAARTNNTVGVAGVAWIARILPVRVLGREGGNSFDISAAMTWATGGSVPGLPVNTNPARVVNLSLGGAAPPQTAYQEAINGGIQRGAIFVIAAGNENVDATNTTPCNQENVICVGSTSLGGRRSSFSNFGAKVDVMASGGEMREDLNGDDYPDGVLSTARDNNNEPAYLFLQGTSMAAPHVAGVVALMAAEAVQRNPAQPLTATVAESILKATASPLTQSQCSGGCGSGLINALAALRRIQDFDPATEAPRLSVTTSRLFFRGSGTQQLLVSNVGGSQGGVPTVTASVSGPLAGNVSFPAGPTVSVPAYGKASLDIAVSTAGLADGTYTVPLTLTGSGSFGTATVTLEIRVGTTQDLDAVIAFVWEDELTGEWQVEDDTLTIAPAARNYAYSIELEPRTYYALATIDDDQDEQYFEEGERTGFWRNLDDFEAIELSARETITGISFDLLPLAPIEE
jgi:serine protease